MQSYSTALLQIVSTHFTADELSAKCGLDNHATQQPPAPHAYFCFETRHYCPADNPDEHIKLLKNLLKEKASFLKECAFNGDDISLLWFPKENNRDLILFSPASLNFLAGSNITLALNPQN